VMGGVVVRVVTLSVISTHLGVAMRESTWWWA
jgi:hypothetical protein